MARRRAGAKFQIRRAIARECHKLPQKRGNNKKNQNLLLTSYHQDKLPISSSLSDITNGRSGIKIISNVEFTKTLVIIDESSSPCAGRIVGGLRFSFTEIYQPECEDISDASTASRSSTPAGIEIITLD